MKYPHTLAYSYVRFSTPEQAKGDSLRRQDEGAEAYCRRRGWTLDESLTLRDLGVSAFRGKNALVGNLKTFLDAVKSGAVKPGSALIVESVDRISRQGIDEGYDLIKSILKAGVVLVTLSPEREFDVSATKSLSKGALEIQLILERASEESEIKSKRVKGAWASMRKRAREQGSVVSRQLPAWVEELGGKLVPVPEHAAAVKRIFHLAANGYGHGAIVKRLTKEKTPPMGKSGRWVRCYVAGILADRRAVGEYQPRTTAKARTPDGPPIPNYFPAVVSEDEWLAARAGAAQRRGKGGRASTRVNVFAGLIKNARDGDGYHLSTQTGRRPVACQPILRNSASVEGTGACRSFPFLTFEKAVLSLLREIDPKDVLSQDKGPDETAVLEGQVQRLEASIAVIGDDMDANGESPFLLKRLRDKEAELKDANAKLDEAKQKAARPLSQSWQHCQSLIKALDSATDADDARLRLRAELRRVVNEVWLFVAPHGRDRIAQAQIAFNGGQSRSYWILHRPPKANKAGRTPGLWWACSLKHDTGDLTGLQNLKGQARDEASARFEADLVPAVLRASEADIAARNAIIAVQGRAPAGIIDDDGIATWFGVID